MTTAKTKIILSTILVMVITSIKLNAQSFDSTGTPAKQFYINKNRATGNTTTLGLYGNGTLPDWLLYNWDGDFRIRVSTVANPLLTIKSDGKIGFGTLTPTEKLHIEDGNIKMLMLNGAGGKANYLEFRENHNAQTDFMRLEYFGQNLACCGTNLQDYLRFKSNVSDSIMVIERATGRIAINKNPPAGGQLNTNYRLDVNGTINATEYRLNGQVLNMGGGSSQWITNGTNIHYSTGNVGIGITSPTQKLDVNGNIKLTGDLIVANTNSTLPVGLNTQYADSKLLSNHAINFLSTQPGYNQTSDGAAFRVDMRTTTAPVFQWFYRPANQSITEDQMLASISKEGNFWTKYLSVSSDFPDVNQQNEHLIAGTVAHFDGRVYVSEAGGSEKGFTNQADSNYQNFLLWVEEGIVSQDFAIANTTDWPDYVFAKNYKLPSLSEVEKMIKEKGHLPTMPSAAEVEKNGFTVNDMTKRMVKTIEELTLHTINQEKKIDEQNKLINDLLLRVTVLESTIKKQQ